MDKNESQWRRAVPGELIYPNQVHVWRVSLDLSPFQREFLPGILSADEMARAARYHFEKDRNRFIAARGMLRKILGSYMGLSPDTLGFKYSSTGKPSLTTSTGDDLLNFNLSHSDAFALYAVSLHRNIGIDIERIRHDVDVEQIARRFFSQGEASSLNRIDRNQLYDVFFQYWTRKEAFLKARGEGISFSMEKMDVSVINGITLSELLLQDDEPESTRWYVQDLLPGIGYAAAIAVEGDNCDINCFDYVM